MSFGWIGLVPLPWPPLEQYRLFASSFTGNCAIRCGRRDLGLAILSLGLSTGPGKVPDYRPVLRAVCSPG